MIRVKIALHSLTARNADTFMQENTYKKENDDRIFVNLSSESLSPEHLAFTP